MTNQRKIEPLELQRMRAHQFARQHRDTDLFEMPTVGDFQAAEAAVGAGYSAVNVMLNPADFGQSIERLAVISASIDLPINVDCRRGRISNENEMVDVLRSIITAGAVGVTLGDCDSDENRLDNDVAVDRIRVARRTADAARMPFVVSAHMETYEPEARIRRAVAYRQAGADCVSLSIKSDETLDPEFVRAIRAPLDVTSSPRDLAFVETCRMAGVRRVSWLDE